MVLCLAACAPRFPAGVTPEVTPHIDLTGPGKDGGQRGVFVTADDQTLPLLAWLPPGQPSAVILAVHGIDDHAGSFAEAGLGWAAQGIAVYAYDQRGFGAAPGRGFWPGWAPLAIDVRDALTVLRQRYPGVPVVLLGASMGGAVTIAAETAISPPARPDRLVLLAPAVWGRDYMLWYQRTALSLVARLEPGATFTGKGLDVWPTDNLEMLYGVSRDPKMIRATRADTLYGLSDLMDVAEAGAGHLPGPVLWMYGAHDEIVPAGPTLAAARAMMDSGSGHENGGIRGDRQFVLYPRGWHMLLRDLEGRTVQADIAAWIAHPTAVVPSCLAHDPATITLP